LADVPNFNSILSGKGITGPKKENLPHPLPLEGLEEADKFEMFLKDPMLCTPRIRTRYVIKLMYIPACVFYPISINWPDVASQMWTHVNTKQL
jgi:hypothetical protein